MSINECASDYAHKIINNVLVCKTLFLFSIYDFLQLIIFVSW
jgi:hypothetical protein